jgi:hypothetical protein
MATFNGDFRETFTTTASPLQARDTFGDLDTIIENYGELERGDKLDAHTVQFLLKEQNHGITKFQGKYTCQYTCPDEQTLTWKTVGEPGNIQAEGTAIFTQSGDGSTSIDYHGKLSLEMDLNKMMAGMLKPVVGQMIAHEMKEYVKRMIRASESAGNA